MSVSAKKNPTRVTICCRKRDPFQGPKLGSCLTLGNELSEETYVLTKQEILLGKGSRVESSRVRKPRRTALLRGSQCTGSVSFKPFPNSSGWWRLISSIFLMVTMVPGQGGAVSISVLPLTITPCKMGYIAAPLVQAP